MMIRIFFKQIIFLLISFIFCLSYKINASGELNQVDVVGFIEKIDIAAEGQNIEGLAYLRSIVLDKKSIDNNIRNYAAFKLKDFYIPEGEVERWKDDNFINGQDVISYISSLTEAEWADFVESRDKVIAGMSTEHFEVKIRQSDLKGLEVPGIGEMSVSSITGLLQSAAERRGGCLEFHSISLQRPIKKDWWVAFGVYANTKGERRVIGLLNEHRIFYDKKKECAKASKAKDTDSP